MGLWRRWTATLVALLVAAGTSACAGAPATHAALAGTELVYRFPLGRTYRARYTEEAVHFTLLEPVQAEPPSATLAYRARRIRDGLFLVAWVGEPRFHTTLLIDLPGRVLHASALRDGQHAFFETARIVKIGRIDAADGKPAQAP